MDGLFFCIPRYGSTGFNPIPFRFEVTSGDSQMENHPAEARIRCSGEQGSTVALRS